MKDISTKQRGRHSMNRACEINCGSFSCSFIMVFFVIHTHTHTHTHTHHNEQVVLRRDLLDGPPTAAAGSLSPQGSPGLGSFVHMAETYYKVLSVSSFAPRRSCLILAKPVTGDFICCVLFTVRK